MPDYRLILSLVVDKKTYRHIQAIAGCSPRDIRRVRDIADEHGIITPQQVADIDEEQLNLWFPDGRSLMPEDFLEPDYEAIVSQLVGKTKPTRKQLHVEYLATPTDKQHYSFERFCQLVKRHMETKDIAHLLNHEPGNVMQVDWAGTKLRQTDVATGAPVILHLFVASLPYSGMMFAYATEDEKQDSWYAAHAAAFAYFGGVPNQVVPDNAAVATDRKAGSQRNRMRVNANYREFLRFYDCQAMPARIFTPQDKGSVEAAVKVVTRNVIRQLADTPFISLAETNAEVKKVVDEINDRTHFRNGNRSRRDLFVELEQEYLYPLPEQPWQKVTRVTRTVNRDVHIQIDGRFYSVPADYIGREVTAVCVGDQITVTADGKVIAEHKTAARRGQFVTDRTHLPRALDSVPGVWSVQAFVRSAARIGPNTKRLIAALLEGEAPWTKYRQVTSLLELVENKTGQQYEWAVVALEQACEQVWTNPKRGRVSSNQVKQQFAAAFQQVRASSTQQRATTLPHRQRAQVPAQSPQPAYPPAQAYLTDDDDFARQCASWARPTDTTATENPTANDDVYASGAHAKADEK